MKIHYTNTDYEIKIMKYIAVIKRWKINLWQIIKSYVITTSPNYETDIKSQNYHIKVLIEIK